MTTEIETKPWWQSKTKIGILVSSISVIAAGVFGIAFDVGMATEVVFGIITLGANLYASHARNTATQPIDMKQVLPGLKLP